MNRRELLKKTLTGFGAYTTLWRDARAQGTSRVPKLKITAIRAARLRGSFHPFVRVYTDQGLTGTGEFVDSIVADEIVNRHIAPELVGWDPLNIEAIYRRLWTGPSLPNGIPPVFMRGMGGPLLAAISGLEIALWDLAGKAMGVPIYRLLGGRVRLKVPVYFDVQNPKHAAEVLKTTGVKMIKTPIGGITRAGNNSKGFDPGQWSAWRLTNRQIDDIVTYVASLREAIGPQAGMAIECHTVYEPESAIMIARALERFHPAWLEEPIPADNPDAMADVRRASPVPIASGENIYTRYGFRPFFERQALSIAQPDMGKTGGLMEARKIAAMAEVYNVPIAPHGMASPLGMTAYGHVCATVPNLFALEWGPYFNKEHDDLMTRPKYSAGFMELPDAPGIGIELNQDAIRDRLLPGQQLPA